MEASYTYTISKIIKLLMKRKVSVINISLSYIRKDFWQDVFFSGPFIWIIITFFRSQNSFSFATESFWILGWSTFNGFYLCFKILLRKKRRKNIRKFIVLFMANLISFILYATLIIVSIFIKQ